MARPLLLVALALCAAPALGGCIVGTAVDAAGTVVGTGVKAGAKVAGATVGVAADGVGAAGRAITGSGRRKADDAR
jgi:hypothetical protein